jgi:hypothetical protein
MQRNHFAVATEFFQTAMANLRSHIAGAPLSNELSTLASGASNAAPHNSINVNANTSPPLLLAGEELIAESVEAKYFVYTHGMILNENIASDNLQPLIAVFCCVVLYNLALTHHKEGMLGSDLNMRVALILYYESAMILEESLSLKAVSLRPSFLSSCQLQAILYSNMAHIHLELCDHATFRSCLWRVEHIIYYGKHTLSQISNFPMLQIVLNLFMMTAYPIACAA